MLHAIIARKTVSSIFFSDICTLCTAHLPLALVLAAVTQVGAALLTQVLLAAQHLFLGLPTATALQSHLQTLQTHTNNFIFTVESFTTGNGCGKHYQASQVA